MDSFLHFLKVAGMLCLLFLVVPIAGACLTASWRGAWELSRIWLRSMGIIMAIAAVFWLIALPFMP
jgi:hypothetical protein